MNTARRQFTANIYTVVLAYAFFAGLWILLSDQAMALLISDPDTLVRVSMSKGWAFVAITSLLLYFLVKRLIGQLAAAHQRELELEREKLRAPVMLNAIADSTEDAIFAKDEEGRYMLFNNAAARFVGKPAEAVLGKDDRSLFPADQAEELMATGRRVMAAGQTETNEERLQTAGGEKVFLATKGPLRDGEGMICGIFGISRDITERKRMEAALSENEGRLRLLTEHAPVALALFDRNMRYLAVNRHWLEDFGVGDRDLIGYSHYEIFPDLPKEWKAAHQRGLAGETIDSEEGEPFGRSDGQVVWSRWSVRPWKTADGGIGGIVIFSENITARKQAELEVSNSERRFHDIVEASADWVWEVDAEVRYTYVSESVESMLGYTPAEILGKTPFDMMPPGEAERVRAKFQAYAARKAMFRDLDNINLHKDGSVRHVQTNGMPILAPDGSLLGYRGLDRDITASKEAEAALRSLADDMQATLQAVPDLLFELDAEGRYLAVKASREVMLAAPPGELLGRSVSEVLPPDASRTVMDALAAASLTGSDYGRTITLPLAQETRYFEISVARKPVIEGQADRFIVLSRDITTRKTGEVELQQRYDELERFNRATVGRELDMISMKIQINAMSQELGRAPPYPLDFLKDEGKA